MYNTVSQILEQRKYKNSVVEGKGIINENAIKMICIGYFINNILSYIFISKIVFTTYRIVLVAET